MVSYFVTQRLGGFAIMETFRASGGRDKDSDAALVAAAKGGEMHAFEELVFRHERRAFALAQRITNNREDAEDVVQESLHKSFLHLGTFQEKSSFSTWLTRIVMNEAFMLLRRRRGVFEVLPDGAGDAEEPFQAKFVDQRPSPEQSCWLRERMALLTEAINRLGPNVRNAVVLRAIEERSAEETAQILGTSTAAVKARLFHARRKLRRSVNPQLIWGVHSAGPGRARRY
jgi:RNA polymerase sigma-70 factor, ECF subfamily